MKLCNGIFKIVGIFLDKDLLVFAGNATLKILTAFFPFCMLILAVLNWLPGYSPDDLTDRIFSSLSDMPQIRAAVLQMMYNLKEQSTGLLASIAALTTLWSASSGVSSIQKGLRKVSPAPYTFVRYKLLSVTFTVVLIILVPVFLLVDLLGSTLLGLLSQVGKVADELVSVISRILDVTGIISAFAAFVLVILVYTQLAGRRSLRSQLPGAVFTTVTWGLFTKVFELFIPVLWKSSLYGSLATVFLAAMWLQIAISILFIGSIINRQLADRKRDSAAIPEAAKENADES